MNANINSNSKITSKLSSDRLELLYFQLTDLWKKLCEEHNCLYELTCEEYKYLLGSELEKIENITSKKEAIISHIAKLDDYRSDIIQQVNKYSDQNVSTVTELLKIMHQYEEAKGKNHLFKFNSLLIDIIEKIQDQNKKNQIFINKALLSLKDIRESAMGKTYDTYNAKGATKLSPRINR